MIPSPDTTHTHGKRVSTPIEAVHPLDPLNKAEIGRIREALAEGGHLGEHDRVAALLPVDPRKMRLLRGLPATRSRDGHWSRCSTAARVKQRKP